MKDNNRVISENNITFIQNTSTLTFEEACAYLKVSKSFLYKATSERTIPHYKPTGGKILRFKKEELDQWLSQNRQATKEEIANSI